MLCEGYIYLYKEGILKKRVYDHIGLQKLLNNQIVTTKITADFIDILLANKIIHSPLTEQNFNFLQKFGIFKPEIKFSDGYISLSSESVIADLSNDATKRFIIEKCL